MPYCQVGRSRRHAGLSGQQPDPGLEQPRLPGKWDEAARNLHSTNNFPEFTGRVCPAPCEASCTLNIDDNPVTIKTIECAIVDRGSRRGSSPSRRRTRPARGSPWSAPARRASPARSSSRAPAMRHVFEKNAKAGGLLRYGIPDFKMEKHHIDRRIAQMEAEGVVFHYGAHVGVNVDAEKLVDRVRRRGAGRRRREGRATCRCPAASSKGIHFAMEFLTQQNRRVAGEPAERRRADPRRGQACRRHRRRRHRLGLHRHLDPPGRALGHQVRNPAEAAGAREQGADLAGLAAEAAHLVEPRGRRRARLRRDDRRAFPAPTAR